MVDEQNACIRFDQEFIEAVQSCDLKKVKILTSSLKRIDVEIPDQKASIFTGYQIYYKSRANGKVELINTDVTIIVYLGKYINCNTSDFKDIVEDYYFSTSIRYHSSPALSKEELLEMFPFLING